MNINRGRSWVAACLFSVGIAACSGDSAVPLVDAGNDLGQIGDFDARVCAQETCSCGALSGVRTCDADGVLSSCQCTAPVVDIDSGSDDERACWAGLYLGNFTGSAGFIIPTTPVTGLDFAAGKPALQITLAAPSNASEFVVIGSGVMRGNANGTFPFEATINGELDCHTKQFKATIAGYVQLFLDGVHDDFTGTMVSTYDTTTHAFTDGTWTVTGTTADGGSDIGLTGMGMWKADYTADGGVGSADGGSDGGLDGGP